MANCEFVLVPRLKLLLQIESAISQSKIRNCKALCVSVVNFGSGFGLPGSVSHHARYPVSNWVTIACQAVVPCSEGRQICWEGCSIVENEILQNSEKEEVAIDWRCPEQEWTTVGESFFKGTKQARGLGY